MDTPLGPLLALGSSAAIGTSSFLGGLISRRVSAVAVLGVSQALSLVVLAAALAVTGLPSGLGWLPWSVLAAVFAAAGMVLLYRALATGTVGVVAPLSATCAIVPVLAGFAAGERPGALVGVGMLLAFGGAVLAAGPELGSASPGRGRAVLLALAAAALIGFALTAMARGSATSPVATMTGMRLTSVTLVGIVALSRRSLGGVGVRDLPLLAVVGVLDVSGNLLYGYATTFGLLSLTAVINSLYPVVTVTLAAVVLRERLRPVQAVGVLAALGGVALIAAG